MMHWGHHMKKIADDTISIFCIKTKERKLIHIARTWSVYWQTALKHFLTNLSIAQTMVTISSNILRNQSMGWCLKRHIQGMEVCQKWHFSIEVEKKHGSSCFFALVRVVDIFPFPVPCLKSPHHEEASTWQILISWLQHGWDNFR